jgi:hypothetical protein
MTIQLAGRGEGVGAQLYTNKDKHGAFLLMFLWPAKGVLQTVHKENFFKCVR